MKVTFLGTSSGTPTRHRNVTSIALQFTQQARLWLFDCGEGTQHQILRSPLKLSQLEKIFITHLHGDHLFGLSGLLASRSLQDGALTPVTIYGPQGLGEYVKATLDLSRTHLRYPIRVEIISPGIVCEDDTTVVTTLPVQHGMPAFGYAVRERDQIGRFDVERAASLGITPGPLYGKLKAGETVTLADGTKIDGKTLVGKDRPGRKFVFCGDTTFTPRAVELAQNADLLIHEATYAGADRALADRANHSTATMAATVARDARAKSLYLTHFSARYESEGGISLGDLLEEARAIFPETFLARDFACIGIERKEAE